jgi:UDP-N-acetylmuramoylalanine--D-glutamate ligase
LGKNYDKNLKQYDIIFRSPGYPVRKIKNQKPARFESRSESGGSKIKNRLSSPMKLFFELCPTKNIIGVTGTKGKGTTSALIYEILKKAGKRVWLGGNIGIAPFEFIHKIKKNDWVVLELSSFQLEDMEVSPKIAVITNFYREHLAPADPNNPNYHRSLKDYWNAKFNIFKYQKQSDKLIINYKLLVKLVKQAKQKEILTFSARNKKADGYFINDNLLKIRHSTFDIRHSLPGEHNKENVAAAVEAAKLAGVKKSIIEKAVKNFRGLEHRLEYVGKVKAQQITPHTPLIRGALMKAPADIGVGGFVKYYNDSFATTPESAITALNSFDAPIILIAGGAEKKSDFGKLAKVIKKKVKFTVLLNGKATPRLKGEILKAGFLGKNIKLVYNMKEAVRTAKREAFAGDVVLLSPACASFGMFVNYKERGEMFKKEVKGLA